MFCPKCGIETVEGHKFCKSCGTNLQLVSDALEGGDDTLGQLRVDFDSLKRSLGDVVKEVKVGLGVGAGSGGKRGGGLGNRWWETDMKRRSTTHPLGRDKRRLSYLKSRDWLRYSWQHNVRDGLISLFGGVGLGIFLYYMGREVINSGVLHEVEGLSRVQGIESILRLIWLVALMPILKGIAHLAYGAFFAESISTLSEKFLSPPVPQDNQTTARVRSFPAQTYAVEVPSSVTEQTTNILETNAERGARNAE